MATSITFLGTTYSIPGNGQVGWGEVLLSLLQALAYEGQYQATSAHLTASTAKYIAVNATGGARTITLPTAVGKAGRPYSIKKVDASGNAVTVDGAGSETIDGAATLSLSAQWDSCRLVSDGANWLKF